MMTQQSTQKWIVRHKPTSLKVAMLIAFALIVMLHPGRLAQAQSTPTGPAGGDLSGTYPNPTLSTDRVRKVGDSMTGALDITIPGIQYNNPVLKLRLDYSVAGSGARQYFSLSNSNNAAVTYAGVGGFIVSSTAGAENGALRFFVANGGTLTEKAVLYNNGFFGIGTTTPSAPLHVLKDWNGSLSTYILGTFDSYDDQGRVVIRRANGDLGAETQVLSGQGLGGFQFRGWHSGGAFGASSSASVSGYAAENFTSTGIGGGLQFSTTPIGTTTPTTRMQIDAGGNVGVGTIDPSQGGVITNARFTIVSPDNTHTAFATSNGTVPRFALANLSSGGWSMWDYAGNAWHSGIIQVGGRIGLGTATPAYLFDAQGGQINASGGFCMAGDCKSTWAQVGSISQWTTNAGGHLYFNTGNVGLGTVSPAYKLDVQGGQFNASGGLCIAGDCKTAWSQVGTTSPWLISGANTYYSIGRVGIGTATPTKPLEVLASDGEAARLYRNTNGIGHGVNIRFALNNSSGAEVDYAGVHGQIAANTAGLEGGSLVFTTATGGSATEKMRITSAGSVGIGTTTPASSLDVSGNTLTVGSESGTAGRANNTTKLARVAIPSYAATSLPFSLVGGATTSSANIASIGGQVAGMAAATEIAFVTAATNNVDTGTTRMTINSAGNVGVGTTTPAYKLDVAGQIRSSTGGFIFPDGSSQTTAATSGGVGSITGVTAGAGLLGGGTTGVATLDIGAGTGVSVAADAISVNYGSTAGTAVQGNTSLTVTAGSGMSGGGPLTLGSGGTLTLTNADKGSTQNIFKNVADSAGTAQFSAATNNDAIRFAGTGNTSVTFDAATRKVIIDSTGSGNGTITSVTAGAGLTGGGTSGGATLDIGAGTGVSVAADAISVNYGSTAGTAVQGNTSLTVTAGSGMSGGGPLTLGSGGTLTLTNADKGSTQNIFKNVANATGTTQFSAATNNDAVRFAGSGGTSVTFDAATKKVIIDSSNSTPTAANIAAGQFGLNTGGGDYTFPHDVTVMGNIAAKYQDVAEWVNSSQALTAGTVVVLDQTRSNQVVASFEAYDTRVAGVISRQPGIALGVAGAGKVLVATTGRVLIKVDASSGAIHIGDLLVTSDKPGVAMKSQPISIGSAQLHRPGTLIGKALESLESGTGEMLVLLSLQ